MAKCSTQLRVGIVWRRECPTRPERSRIQRDEPLAEPVDADIGVPSLLFQSGTQKCGTFLPTRLGTAQPHALRRIEQNVYFGPVNGIGRDGNVDGVRADGDQRDQHAEPAEPQRPVLRAGLRRGGLPAQPRECQECRRQPRQHRPHGVEFEGHVRHLEPPADKVRR